MSITELSVKKPLAVLMFVFLFVALGIFGFANMGADLMPSVNVPVVMVSTTYPGASPEEIENQITKPIEDALSGISGIDKMNSVSSDGYGYTTIVFTMEANMQTAFMDVQQAVSSVTGRLPSDASKPVIQKFDMNDSPVLILSVSDSNTVSYGELYNSADKVKDSLQKLNGVGSVTLEGGMEKQLRINVDKTLIDQYGITMNTILGTLKSENLNVPAGQLKQGNSNESIRVLSQFKSLEEIQNLLIPTVNGGTVRLSDVAEVKLDYPDNSELLRMNGKNSIGIFVKKQSDANIVKTVDNVKNELKKMEKTLPKGVNISIAQDSSTFIKASVKGVESGIIEGIITTSIVMFIFLKHVRSSMIILVSIPTSLISTFLMMYVFKFTLNTISLLALSLCIGILVDDSIVVIENIQRHLKQGKSLIRATIDGRKEIAMAAISITLCDVVVFGPIAFMSGMIGQFFKQFGLTVVFAALFSLIISFTLTPMLASRLLEEENVAAEKKSSKRKNKFFEKFARGFNKAFDKFNSFYKKFLIYAIDHRVKVIIAVIIMLVFSVALIPMKAINTEFMPTTDQGNLTIAVSLTPNSDIKSTDSKIREIESHLKGMKEVNQYLTVVGNGSGKESNGTIYITLTNKNDRKKSQSQLAAELRKWSKTVTGAQIFVSESGSLGGGSGKPISISIVGTEEKTLKELSDKIDSVIKSIPGITDLENDVDVTQNEINIKVDKLMASQFGVTPSEIASTLSAVSKQGSNAGVFRKDGDDYDIIVKFDNEQIKTKEDIAAIKITSSSGEQISLDQVADVAIEDSVQEKHRSDREEMVTLSANIDGRPLGSVNEDIQKAISKIHMPDGYRIQYGGDQDEMATTFTSLVQVLIISIMLVYMILVVLYESFLTPAIRMLSLPCAAIGALIALAVTRNSLNMVTMIGLIMLDGLASKNGTLLIDYTNTLMKKGLPLREALIEAGTTRLRPILMTTITMIVGMLPSALAMTEGSEYRSGMSITIIGGMITSTLISPIIIPVVYTLMDDLKKKIGRKKNKKNINITGKGVGINEPQM